MGQIKTRCSTAAGLFLILLTVIAGFSSCKSNQKDIIPSAEYAPYVMVKLLILQIRKE